MRRRFGQSLRVGIAPGAVALLKTSRFGGHAPELVAELAFDGGSDPASIAATLRQLLDGCASWPVSIVLADELARIWQVTPPAGSARLADLEAAAALRFQTLFGEPAGAWQLAAGWDAARPFLVAALPRQLLASIGQVCAAQRTPLVALAPQFVAGFNQWRASLKAGAWYGLVQQRVLTMAAIEDGAIRAVRAAALPDGADCDWLAAHVAREALRLNLSVPARLSVSGHAPAAWSKGATHPALACQLLGQGQGGGWSDCARLAATGSRP
ncbi:hypothetical protein HF313_10460 [Massilia atriviolacea]|uniref:Uncharacterized protein n=1 Tax=Massilia atriviolacea TaxID=2495579 RepID=A0A430HHY9_9BURK|nr:hypothetical protein [Massilia atriviolacea]RSZ57128.1 hypothetical protein EJB06_20595 [Massilia atriviolacea]